MLRLTLRLRLIHCSGGPPQAPSVSGRAGRHVCEGIQRPLQDHSGRWPGRWGWQARFSQRSRRDELDRLDPWLAAFPAVRIGAETALDGDANGAFNVLESPGEPL